MPSAKTHGENRHLLCFICNKKGSAMRSITESNYLDAIRKYFAKNYNPEDRKKARGLCSRCRNKFLQLEKDDADPEKTADPSILDDPVDWDSMYFPPLPDLLGSLI